MLQNCEFDLLSRLPVSDRSSFYYRGEPQALTAYGGLADVPGDIDLL